MNNHLYIRSLLFERDAQGQWSVTRVITNKGKFRIEPELNEETLDKDIVERFLSYIVGELKQPLEEFILKEDQEKE